MPIRIDQLSTWGTQTRASQSARHTGISRLERCEWTLQPSLGRPRRSKQGSGTRLGLNSSTPSNGGPSIQELLTGKQAITARLTNAENNEAYPQHQQHRQAQPAHQAQQIALQLAGDITDSMATAAKDVQHATDNV